MTRWYRTIVGWAFAVSAPAVTLASPDVAAAQATPAVTPAELVGTWVNTQWRWEKPDSQYVAEWIWTFRADSTWTLRARHNGVADTTDLQWLNGGVRAGRWTLRGDTLLIARDSQPGSKGPALIDRGPVARQGDRLVWAWGGRTVACADTLRRVDDAKPLPPPNTAPRPITIARTALVGTWVNVDTSKAAGKTDKPTIRTDSLTLRADGTYARRMWFDQAKAPDDTTTGRWALYPGDVLTPWASWPGIELTLKDGQLMLGSCQHFTMYKRVSP